MKKRGGTISTPGAGGCIIRTYIGFMPSKKEMSARGWTFEWMGAEGPYYIKTVGEKIYRLQIVQQGPDNRSVINLNNNIKGSHQNCCITYVNNPEEEFKMLYFGYIGNIDDLDNRCKSVGIINNL
jgi:hypothetical protein